MFAKIRKFSRLVAISLPLSAPGLAQASDWGCTVLLCLANPAGPRAVAECVDPINRLYKALTKFPPDPFPTCAMVSVTLPGSPRAHAGPARSYFDPCPAGTEALGKGLIASSGGRQTYRGIGDGSQFRRDRGEGSDAPTEPKVCVGQKTGEQTVEVGEGEGAMTITADVFDEVVLMQPYPNPRAINVYINDELTQVVRY